MTEMHETTLSGLACHDPGPLADRSACGYRMDPDRQHAPGDDCRMCFKCLELRVDAPIGGECPECGGDVRLIEGLIGPHWEYLRTAAGIMPGQRRCTGQGQQPIAAEVVTT